VSYNVFDKMLIHVDRLPLACSSDATSDSASNGVGVCFTGWHEALVVGIFSDPATSDALGFVNVQYHQTTTDLANPFKPASDYLDTDYTAFATDAVSSETAFDTSDDSIALGEGVVAVKVDLVAAGLTHGHIRGRYNSNGGAAVSAGFIILAKPTGRAGGLESGPTAVVPSSF
jgi:hypothetical protein